MQDLDFFKCPVQMQKLKPDYERLNKAKIKNGLKCGRWAPFCNLNVVLALKSLKQQLFISDVRCATLLRQFQRVVTCPITIISYLTI